MLSGVLIDPTSVKVIVSPSTATESGLGLTVLMGPSNGEKRVVRSAFAADLEMRARLDAHVGMRSAIQMLPVRPDGDVLCVSMIS